MPITHAASTFSTCAYAAMVALPRTRERRYWGSPDQGLHCPGTARLLRSVSSRAGGGRPATESCRIRHGAGPTTACGRRADPRDLPRVAVGGGGGALQNPAGPEPAADSPGARGLLAPLRQAPAQLREPPALLLRGGPRHARHRGRTGPPAGHAEAGRGAQAHGAG